MTAAREFTHDNLPSLKGAVASCSFLPDLAGWIEWRIAGGKIVIITTAVARQSFPLIRPPDSTGTLRSAFSKKDEK